LDPDDEPLEAVDPFELSPDELDPFDEVEPEDELEAEESEVEVVDVVVEGLVELLSAPEEEPLLFDPRLSVL
jgi:hypothetical protein